MDRFPASDNCYNMAIFTHMEVVRKMEHLGFEGADSEFFFLVIEELSLMLLPSLPYVSQSPRSSIIFFSAQPSWGTM